MKKRIPAKFIPKIILKFILPVMLSILLLVIGIYTFAFFMGPPDLTREENTIFYDEFGRKIGEGRGTESREWVPLEDISPYLIDATLAVEDQHFYNHHGFDFKRILGAVIKDIKTWSLKEGASTLTQQYARNLYLTHEKTWTRKIKEAFYTIRLEMHYSKDDILEGYLNTVYYGHGSHGVGKASRYFFNKSVNDLSLAEAAMLAGIPKGPTYYSPLNDPERAKQRQALILSLMKHNNRISEQDYQLAVAEQLSYTQSVEERKPTIGAYFQDTVLKEASQILNMERELIESAGYQIYTTLNLDTQKTMENTVAEIIDPNSEVQVGALAMEPDSGAIKAMVGGRNYQESPFNRTTQAKRMVGSTFKPFLYYAALHHGYTPSTLLESKPTIFELENGNVYQPSNYNDYYAYEPITLAQALALSDNIYAVKTNMYLGSDTVVQSAKKFGITSEMPSVPSLALGSASISVLEMVRGYGMFANGGYEIDAHSIQKITDRQGNVIYDKEKEKKSLILEPRKAFILTQMMTGMFDEALNGYTSVTGNSIAPTLTRTYAGKSGTTKTDSWMIGFTPSLVSGVWIGFDDNERLTNANELSYSKKIWSKFMEEALAEKPEEHFTVPNGLVAIPIDPSTGERATPYCPTSTVMFFEKGTEPAYHCSEHFFHGSNPNIEIEDEEEKGTFEKWFDVFFR